MTSSIEGFTNEKKIDYLITEWSQLEKSCEWNFDIIEKHRNYGFVFVATVFGVSGSKILGQYNFLWLIVPPVILIMTLRIITQLEFISIRLNRRLDIEVMLSKMVGDNFYFRSERIFTTDTSSGFTYALTYSHIFIFFFAIFIYSMNQALVVIDGIYLTTYLILYFGSAAFVLLRCVYMLVRRYRRRRTEKVKDSISINEAIIKVGQGKSRDIHAQKGWPPTSLE